MNLKYLLPGIEDFATAKQIKKIEKSYSVPKWLLDYFNVPESDKKSIRLEITKPLIEELKKCKQYETNWFYKRLSSTEKIKARYLNKNCPNFISMDDNVENGIEDKMYYHTPKSIKKLFEYALMGAILNSKKHCELIRISDSGPKTRKKYFEFTNKVHKKLEGNALDNDNFKIYDKTTRYYYCIRLSQLLESAIEYNHEPKQRENIIKHLMNGTIGKESSNITKLTKKIFNIEEKLNDEIKQNPTEEAKLYRRKLTIDNDDIANTIKTAVLSKQSSIIDEFEVVSGDLIPYYYNPKHTEDRMNLGSCMSRPELYQPLKCLYGENSNIEMLIHKTKNDKIDGRALIFKTISGKKVLNRPYATNDEVFNKMKVYCDIKDIEMLGYYYNTTTNHKIQIEPKIYTRSVYLDNFAVYDIKQHCLVRYYNGMYEKFNNSSFDEENGIGLKFTTTNGEIYPIGKRPSNITCVLTNETIPLSKAEFIIRLNGFGKKELLTPYIHPDVKNPNHLLNFSHDVEKELIDRGFVKAYIKFLFHSNKLVYTHKDDCIYNPFHRSYDYKTNIAYDDSGLISKSRISCTYQVEKLAFAINDKILNEKEATLRFTDFNEWFLLQDAQTEDDKEIIKHVFKKKKDYQIIIDKKHLHYNGHVKVILEGDKKEYKLTLTQVISRALVHRNLKDRKRDMKYGF
jgi:hypothetical protein